MPEKKYPYCRFCKVKKGCGRYDKTKEVFYCVTQRAIYQKGTNVFYNKKGDEKLCQ